MRIALVEDNKVVSSYIQKLLLPEGIKVIVFSNGEKLLLELKKEFFPMIILDINLPGRNGYDICKIIRKNQSDDFIPKILMLSERTGQKEINKGLKIGADDYLKKPFDDEELLLRIILHSRNSKNNRIENFNYSSLKINCAENIVYRGDECITISKIESKFFEYMINNKGLTVTRSKIYQNVWETDYSPGNKNLDVFLVRLKRKFPELKDKIIAKAKVGYKLKDL